MKGSLQTNFDYYLQYVFIKFFFNNFSGLFTFENLQEYEANIALKFNKSNLIDIIGFGACLYETLLIIFELEQN